MRERKNQGFTLVEMVVAVSILGILLTILVPSLNSVLGFDAQKATQSICAALDKTKIESMSRLVGEMKLSCEADGYYVTYYLDRGKGRGLDTGEQPEWLAKKRVQISYIDSKGITYQLKEEPLILTFDRESGGFRAIQEKPVTLEEMEAFLAAESSFASLSFHDREEGLYCEEILITCGLKSRKIKLNPVTGSYTVTAL